MTSRAADEVPLLEPSVYEKPACGKNFLLHDRPLETAFLRRQRRYIATEILFHVQEHCVLLVALQPSGIHFDKSFAQVNHWANLNAKSKQYCTATITNYWLLMIVTKNCLSKS